MAHFRLRTLRRDRDEAHIKIRGKKHYIWRAPPSLRYGETSVDSDGAVLDIFVSRRRNKKAAQKFFSVLFGQYQNPSRVITDRLRLYRSVVPETFPKTKHIKGKWLNNRVENSHIIVRERERKMKKFKSEEQAQSFLNRYEFIRTHLKPKQHQMAPLDFIVIHSTKVLTRSYDPAASVVTAFVKAIVWLITVALSPSSKTLKNLKICRIIRIHQGFKTITIATRLMLKNLSAFPCGWVLSWFVSLMMKRWHKAFLPKKHYFISLSLAQIEIVKKRFLLPISDFVILATVHDWWITVWVNCRRGAAINCTRLCTPGMCAGWWG
ncbi:transposase [Oligoflexia bacterium]|nr:transposase [Oligoflexia bacterium]